MSGTGSAAARTAGLRARTARLLQEERWILDEAGRTLDPDAYAVLLAVAADDRKRLPELLAALSDAQRRSCVPHLKAWRARLLREWGVETRPRKQALAIAGAGCHTGAAAVAQWLAHDDLDTLQPSDTVLLLGVLAGRPAPWLGDVARRLADRLRPGSAQGHLYLLAERLVLLSGCPVPTTEGFVHGWAGERTWPHRRQVWPAVVDGAPGPRPSERGMRSRPLADRLRDDPFLDALVPRLFDVDGVGGLLAGGAVSWPAALAALAAEGRLDRTALLDGCLSRLLRGGRPGELRGFLAVLTALGPTDDECAGRAAELVRLLPDAPSPVAGFAQERLAALDAAGRLDPEHLTEASRAVLFRTEKKLVRAQLTWLDTAARRDRRRAGAAVLAAADALGHEDTSLQERALNLISRHLRYAGEAVRGELAAAAQALSPVLRPRAAELLGLETAGCGDTGGPAGAVDVLPPVPGPVPVAPPLATAAEVAEEVGAVLTAGWKAASSGSAAASTVDAAAFERALDGLVRHAYRDRAGLVRALEPVARAHRWSGAHGGWGDPGPWTLRYVVAALSGEQTPIDPSGSDNPMARPRERGITPFGEVLGARMLEAAWRTATAPPPFLLATPTYADGRLDPSELAARLAEYERLGAEPGPCDLDQALLRLDPACFTGEALAAARRLSAPAGQRLAAWLEAGGPAVPEFVRAVGKPYRYDGERYLRVQLSSDAAVLPSEPGPAFRRLLGTHTGGGAHYETPWNPALRLWPAVLPAHRELVALRLQHVFATVADDDWHGGAVLLLLLAETGGPAGQALHLALAHCLGARRAGDRTAAVDALLSLAARGDLDPVRLGGDLAETVALGTVKPNRLLESLREVYRAGAPGVVWPVLAAALPGLLAVEKPLRGLPDLLALAAECAGASGARGPVDGLAETAARGGGSRLVKEARRLRDVLEPPARS